MSTHSQKGAQKKPFLLRASIIHFKLWRWHSEQGC
jgi:hypothetical protein